MKYDLIITVKHYTSILVKAQVSINGHAFIVQILRVCVNYGGNGNIKSVNYAGSRADV